MVVKKTDMDRQEKSLVPMQLPQQVEIRKHYKTHLPTRRHPLIGYIVSIPIVGLALLAVMVGNYLLPRFYFPSIFLFLAVVLVALFCGVGPALFAILLSAVALDYFYMPQYPLISWDALLQILPFVVSCIIIAIIISQREFARRQALFAEQVANERAVELEQSNQLKDQFLSMASHELKTPITSIRGQAQAVLRRLSKKSELSSEMQIVRTTLEKIDEQTYRLNALVDDLLSLGSMRAGKLELRLDACDLRDVCRSVVEDQRLLTERPIEFAAPATALMVQADSDRLSQVLVNLISNAVKYSPEDRPVQVRVSQQDAYAVLQVQDEGVGIPKEEQKRIFETFYRTSDAQASNKSGWGLGLAICKDIVERHNGRIRCESEQGKGSTFLVELPLSSDVS